MNLYQTIGTNNFPGKVFEGICNSGEKFYMAPF